MAKVKTSALVSHINGKLGGSFFQDSMYGLQLSHINHPVTRRNIYNSKYKNNFQSIALQWSQMSNLQRHQWDVAAGGQGGGYHLFQLRNIIYLQANNNIQQDYEAPKPGLNISNLYANYIPRIVGNIDVVQTTFHIDRLNMKFYIFPRVYLTYSKTKSAQPYNSDKLLTAANTVRQVGNTVIILSIPSQKKRSGKRYSGHTARMILNIYDKRTGAKFASTFVREFLIPS